jgi:hypothetical protein
VTQLHGLGQQLAHEVTTWLEKLEEVAKSMPRVEGRTAVFELEDLDALGAQEVAQALECAQLRTLYVELEEVHARDTAAPQELIQSYCIDVIERAPASDLHPYEGRMLTSR